MTKSNNFFLIMKFINISTDKEKKSFLYHCYPDGKGPDAELIQMLEKDVVESNPNVKFEDIASLEDAKQTLQEAVLLPLLCPELFIVFISFI